MNNNSYKEFSQIYDLLMNDIDYEKWTSFIIDKLGINNNKVLEAACGTGSITSLMAEHNFKVTAFDLSQDMLMRAYEKLGRIPNVKLLNQNMTNFKIDDKFKGAICCCDGINYITSEELLLFFNRINEHLDIGSKFIFDMSTEYKYKTMFNDTYVYDDNEIFYVWENIFDNILSKVDIEINFFVKDKLHKYERITEIQTQYIHRTDEIVNMLNYAGFSDVKIFDDYNDNIVNDKSLRAVFCTTK
ncbi:class I SAM-dependent DNA methyltransferase [Sedimentibacter sp. MB31-C6]|uniref:class I SAM-dependent DNA methyltransferase n=1 Tax=Sedimentibacter sp. MB31-C6 TaxID=3109366 RepID=UPI002DDC9C9D|nr:class I SAM-dependent methyltransferase [Sedimentibacter sp. MB36-C1]WSI04902.1 class I SAM-dependent methyltransferase [Sedimentibacter sp. MB36-C1]